VADRRPELGWRIVVALAAIGAVALALRLWLPTWERRLDDGGLVLIAPFDSGLTVSADIVGYVGLVAGGAAATAIAALIGRGLREYRRR
jgi:hypothetical protein